MCHRVLHACGKGLQEVDAERLAGSHEKAVWLRARRVQAFMRDLCQVQLLLLRERVRVDALSQVLHNVWGEVMLKGVLLPVLNEVLKGTASFWVGVICCAVKAGAITHWGPAVYNWLAEQIGEIGDAGVAYACLSAERLQKRC